MALESDVKISPKLFDEGGPAGKCARVIGRCRLVGTIDPGSRGATEAEDM